MGQLFFYVTIFFFLHLWRGEGGLPSLPQSIIMPNTRNSKPVGCMYSTDLCIARKPFDTRAKARDVDCPYRPAEIKVD